MIRQLHDNFFPNTSSLWVIDIMGLIKDNPFYILELISIIVDLILEHLCSHDDHGSISVDAHIAGKNAHVITKFLFEISELLVGESLVGRRVQRFRHVLH